MQWSENGSARVTDFLMTQGVNDGQMQLNAVGEQLAATHAEGDERDRSVLRWVHPVPDDTPRPSRKVPKPLTTRAFDSLIFPIWEIDNKIACLYVCIGIGLSLSPGFPLRR
jgi:hypothetical protein